MDGFQSLSLRPTSRHSEDRAKVGNTGILGQKIARIGCLRSSRCTAAHRLERRLRVSVGNVNEAKAKRPMLA